MAKSPPIDVLAVVNHLVESGSQALAEGESAAVGAAEFVSYVAAHASHIGHSNEPLPRRRGNLADAALHEADPVVRRTRPCTAPDDRGQGDLERTSPAEALCGADTLDLEDVLSEIAEDVLRYWFDKGSGPL